MSITRVTRDQVESFTIVTNPKRHFASSSVDGTSGDLFVFPRRSPALKQNGGDRIDLISSSFGDSSIAIAMKNVAGRNGSSDISDAVRRVMAAVDQAPQLLELSSSLGVYRYTPTTTFTENTLRKAAVKDLLCSFYRNVTPSAHWGYTNYNCLSFFDARSNAALLYPNVDESTYDVPSQFTFDFYVNPRGRTSNDLETYTAGTVLHLSSSYAVSIASGSQKDFNGRTQGYKIVLQLGRDADVDPSLAVPSPSNMIFESDDNSLQFNTWHHVVIRWGGERINGSTGSILIDGVARGAFAVPIGSGAFSSNPLPPEFLVVGNYYTGQNTASMSSTTLQALFFNPTAALRNGVAQLTTDEETPSGYSFVHPLRADLHDVMIRNEYTTDDVLVTGSGQGLSKIPSDVVFYLPPFFVPSTPSRFVVGGEGGVLQTPFFALDGWTDTPFNVALAFGVGGHYINLENFVKDFASENLPLLFQMSASVITTTTSPESANEFLYSDSNVRRRNLLIMPCDDGNFVPNFDLLVSESSKRHFDDIGSHDPSMISLRDMVSTASLSNSVTNDAGSIFSMLAGSTPENIVPTPGVDPNQVLTILYRTRDPDSDQVTFFDISNLFYGLRILPGTFQITDSSLSGSEGALSVTLRDDGRGNLFRGDCVSSQASWNSVGNIFYNEGVVVVKSPHLYFFGKEQFDVSFQGEQTVHSLRISAFAAANTLNSSSNASYIPVSASFNANELDPKFVYVSDIYGLDRDMNVVMRTTLAQPVLKRTNDRYLFRTRLDF